MLLPGNAMTHFGQEVEEIVVAAERSGPSVPVPVGLADDLLRAA